MRRNNHDVCLHRCAAHENATQHDLAMVTWYLRLACWGLGFCAFGLTVCLGHWFVWLCAGIAPLPFFHWLGLGGLMAGALLLGVASWLRRRCAY
jgi:hypothetical protein